MSYFHRLSATLFYLLSGSFFVAYLLSRNGIGGMWPAWWLGAMDLALLLCALLYGGTSIYRSLGGEDGSRALAWGITIPFALVFAAALIVNYLPVQINN